jgi:transposase
MHITTIGLDLAKSVFQVHGVEEGGSAVLRRSLRRSQVLTFFGRLEPCVVGIEACGTAHYWARELAALGHDVRQVAPWTAKAYAPRNKTDAADAAAICEAVSRRAVRLMPTKSAAQQAQCAVHTSRALLVRQRTMIMNAIRAHMAEFGLVARTGPMGLRQLLERLTDPAETRIPEPLLASLRILAAQLAGLEQAIGQIEADLVRRHKADPDSVRLATIPGFGPILAGAVLAATPEPSRFASGREFAASLGLTPRINGTGGKVKLGAISNRGNGYVLRLLVNGAQAVLNSPRAKSDPWLERLLATKPRRVAAVALANKMARIAWAIMVRGQPYRSQSAAA